jgi:hypothetical protein
MEFVTGAKSDDVVCGTRIYSPRLARVFLESRSFGYGWEIEQLILASIHEVPFSSFQLETNRQADGTNSEKLEDGFQTILLYQNELRFPAKVRQALHSLLFRLKSRQSFTFDMEVFGKSERYIFNYLERDGKAEAYANQTLSDAYSLSLL